MNGRRVFTDVAAKLREARPDDAAPPGTGAGWLIAVSAVSAAFQEMNSAFDPQRFLIDAGAIEAPPNPLAEAAELILRHVRLVGRTQTIKRLLEAGAKSEPIINPTRGVSEPSAKLVTVPPENLPALMAALREDISKAVL